MILDTLNANPANILVLKRESAAVRTYVATRLRHQSTVAEPSAGRFNAIADRIGSYDQPFLFARLAIHEILAEPALADSDAALTPILELGHSGIFEHAVNRLRQADPPVEALLHALTYARGNGFPRTGGVWAIAASAFSDTPITDTDVENAINLAAPYIMQDTEFGVTVYRLAHRTFTEWYRTRDHQ